MSTSQQALARLETSNQLQSADDFDIFRIGETLAKSGYFADAKDVAQCVVKVLAGRELGIPPVAAMTGVYIIQGKPSLSANLMAAIIKRSGKYNYRVVQMDAQVCEIEFFEQGASIGKSAFSLQDAKVAGALDGKNKHTWAAFPRNMLFARALSNGARWYTPDIFSGPIYTPEELDARVSSEGIPEAVTPAPVRQHQPAPTATTDDDPVERERQEIVKDIYATCALLNEKGDKAIDAQGREALWKSTSLKIFVNKEFKVGDGLEALSVEYLKKLHGMLNLRLDAITPKDGSLLP
jgi:hypothetical protein